MKTLEIGAVRGRHEIPVDTFVFDETITNFNIQAIERYVANRMEKEVYPCNGDSYDCVELYVTGLTIVTTSVIKWCAGRDINLTLMHYNTETGSYDPQIIYEGWWF